MQIKLGLSAKDGMTDEFGGTWDRGPGTQVMSLLAGTATPISSYLTKPLSREAATLPSSQYRANSNTESASASAFWQYHWGT